MTRRGLTLLEMLLSVTLLTAVMVAATGWMAGVARAATRLEGPARWEAAAWAVIDVIRDDLAIRDDLPSRAGMPALELENGVLVIRTRHVVAGDPSRPTAGAVEHRYRLVGDRLELTELAGPSRRRTRLLLADVAAARFRLDVASGRLAVEFERTADDGPHVRVSADVAVVAP